MTPYAELYARAKELPSADLAAELDRTLLAAERPRGERLEEAVRLAEMALVARLDPWWAGPPQPNVRTAAARVATHLHDPVALGLGMRLAAGYARLGRVDDEAHRLAQLAARLAPTGLDHPEQVYAEEAARHLEEALFVPSHAYVHELVGGLGPEEAFEAARDHLARGNGPLAAMIVELRLVRSLGGWYVGPPLPSVEAALRRYREQRPPELQDLAVLLARAYVQGAAGDLRAREHVVAVLEGVEAQMLDPQEAIGFQEYVDRDAFDYPYGHVYAHLKDLAGSELVAAVRGHLDRGGLTAAQRHCEMALARRYAPWYWGGDPTPRLRAAVARYAAARGDGDAADGEPVDPDALWCARTLAGLYLATLEGSRHARDLVELTVARDAGEDALLEAVRGAGIPADVGIDELHRLHAEVADVEARVEAFRAQAEAAGGLSEYEREAYAETLRFLEEGEGRTLADLSRTMGDLVEGVAPSGLLRSATSVIEDVLRLGVTGTRAVLRRERIVAELARRDPALRSLERIRSADLQVLDEVAWAVTRENRIAAALEGLGCGLGGATLALVDLPVLVLVNLNAVASIATVYGFDVEDDGERDFALSLLAGGTSALSQLVAIHGDDGEEGELSEVARKHLAGNAALALHTTAAKMATRLARQKLLQLVPILGGAVGAGLNFHFTHATSRAALMAYRLRWLLRRFEGAAG